ncbi:MAG: hypothetical protein JSV74_02970, partial [Dehalococcoidia bacterium]
GAIPDQMHSYGDQGVYTVTVTVTDKDGGSDSDSFNITVNNVSPIVIVNPSTPQLVQYSDYINNVVITGIDVLTDTMKAETSWSVDGSGFTIGLPSNLILTSGDCNVDGVRTCTWDLSGTVDVPAGEYLIRITITDDDGGVTVSDILIEVIEEDATVTFAEDNQVAVLVTGPGTDASQPFSLTFYIKETFPDVSTHGSVAGDISNACVSVQLVPVGPGSPIAPSLPLDIKSNGEIGHDEMLTVIANFDVVPVNAYTVQVLVNGCGFYTGGSEDVLVVYDPSLGFTTGGGLFYWPDDGSSIANAKTNFGYTMKYNKKGQKVQGSLLMISHLEDGSIHRIKSNALYGLSLGESDGFGWASFSGKCTYKEHDWLEPIGNYQFIVYVEDHGDPGGGLDQFWIAVVDGISMDSPATDINNMATIEGGNIVVPHTTEKGNSKN